MRCFVLINKVQTYNGVMSKDTVADASEYDTLARRGLNSKGPVKNVISQGTSHSE